MQIVSVWSPLQAAHKSQLIQSAAEMAAQVAAALADLAPAARTRCMVDEHSCLSWQGPVLVSQQQNMEGRAATEAMK